MNRKKIIVGVIALGLVFVVGFLIIGSLGSQVFNTNAKKDTPSFDSANQATTQFIKNIQEEKYDEAFLMVEYIPQKEEVFRGYMSQINDSVNLARCTQIQLLIQDSNKEITEVTCPYKNEELNRTLRIVFSTSTNQQGKVVLTSYDISYR